MPSAQPEVDTTLFGKLKQFYYKLEDRYYAFLDKLYEGGLNLYKYFVDPIESHGVPSFPVAVLIIIALLAGLWLFALGPILQPSGTLTVSLSVEGNESIANVPVTLLFEGKELAIKNTGSDGTVVFEGVPLNKAGTIRVNHPDFTPLTVDLLLSEKTGEKRISLSHRRFDLKLQDFVVRVTSDTGAAVSGAVVKYEALGSAVQGEVATQPDGTAVIKLDSLDTILSINIEAEQFQRAERVVRASDGSLEVQLALADEGGAGPGEEKGSVVVSVTDAAGNPVAARITLMQEDSSTPLGADNVESGTTRFEEVATVGTQVYASVEPLDSAYLPAQTGIEAITAEEDLQFALTVQRVDSTNSRRVAITVKGNGGQNIEGARVTLYSGENVLLDSASTDTTGRAQFTVDNAQEFGNFYAAVNAENYLPLAEVVTSADAAFELTALAAGNNVEFTVDVSSADGKAASGAKVELLNEQGMFLAVSERAGQAGSATFTGMPASVALRARATLDSAQGDSDVFSVPFAESGAMRIPITLSRPVGKMLVTVKDLVDGSAVNGAFVAALADSAAGREMANCTTTEEGSCLLEDIWQGHDVYLQADANGFDSTVSEKQFVSARQTKLITLYLLNTAFKNQTIINFVGITDDKGVALAAVQPLERGRNYVARFAASFSQGSTKQGVYIRLGNAGQVADEPAVIKGFEFSPAPAGSPQSAHSTSFNPSGECSSDLLNSDVNNEGKKWVEVDYAGVSGVVEVAVKIFVKPTAQPGEKVSLNYRSFAVQNGKYSRNPFDDDLQLERKSQAKDECYAQTAEKSLDIVEGRSVCNDAGTACVAVSFSSSGTAGGRTDGAVGATPATQSSPLITTLNSNFNLNFEIRSFGAVEGESAYAKITSIGKAVRFTDYSGDGNPSFSETLSGKKTIYLDAVGSPSARILFGESKELYSGSLSATGIIPADYAGFSVEFGDSRGAIASNQRSFAVVQGTGTLVVSQLSPREFEVGKNHDLRLTVRSATGEAITDATISFEEETGSPFNGDVPTQVAGDNSPGNGEDGRYVIRRVRPSSAGTFNLIVSRDRYRNAMETLTARMSNFFEFDNPDFLPVSCNATTLRVRNSLDVELTADVYVDPACVKLAAPGLTEVSSQQGQGHYRLVNFRSGSSRVISIAPISNASCQVEFVSSDSRTGTRSLDAPIQVENTCNSFGAGTSAVGYENADGIVYISNNVFQPPRLLVDTFSYLRYGSYSPQMFDPYAADPASYASQPMGGPAAFYQRAGLVDPLTQRPYSQYADPRFAGFAGQQVGIPIGSQARYPGGNDGRFGVAGFPDQYGGGSAFDIRRANFQSTWKIAWVNQDPLPHAFTCKDRQGRAIVSVDSLAPGAAYVTNVSKPGLYTCKLENANKGTIKIKSMCPKKGAVYYTRLLTRCMARKVAGDSGLFDGGQQHAARVAASVKTNFLVYANRFSLDNSRQSNTPGVTCVSQQGGALCKLKITPLVPRNGFAFSIEDRTGSPDYSARVKATNVPEHCISAHSLDTVSTSRALLQPIVSAISTVGLTSNPQFASYVIKFNEGGDCVKLRPRATDLQQGKYAFVPFAVDNDGKFIADSNGAPLPVFVEYELQNNANPSAKFTVRVEFEPTGLLDGRYLYTTIPTTVGDNKLFYRTSTSADPREPGFVLNNLEEPIYMLQSPASTRSAPLEVHANSIAVLTGNENPSGETYNSLSKLQNGFYICSQEGGCISQQGQAQQIKPFTAEQRPSPSTPPILGHLLGDVIGNYKFETLPSNLADADKPFTCSGTNYCTALNELNAVDLARREVESKLKEQYQYVETINLDSSLDNTQDALATCMQQAFAEILAQEAQYQMCKTLADFCSGREYLDYEEEEVEDGESFAGGLTLDSVVGDSGTIVKDVICQETQAGQNLQALRDCLQPGNRACRDRIAARIAGNLRRTSIQSVVREIPVVEVQRPVISFVTKRIQDDPKLARGNINDDVSTGGYNLYTFSVNPEQLVGRNSDAQRGTVLFEQHPPGYDFSKFISAAATGSAAALTLPLRLPGAIYDWATIDSGASPSYNKLQQLVGGFPYVEYSSAQGGSTSINFDRYSPTLLTLNKYPVMRAVDSASREQTTANTATHIGANTCTLQNRPVDPLQLFDSCAEQRSGGQDAYESSSTDNKRPFSRSLVYLVVPGSGGQAAETSAVWPAELAGAPDFQVAIQPEHELQVRGETQPGVSQSLLARLLYPARDGGTVNVQRLRIPAADVRRYAVQVTGCAYSHDPSTQRIILDPSVGNNCASNQWPLTALLTGSTATDSRVVVNNRQVVCPATQGCVLVSMLGNSLRVATVAGMVGSTSIDTVQGGAKLSELAQELLRYYVDESYVPQKLTAAVANGCTLVGDKNSALLACNVVQGAATPASQVAAQQAAGAVPAPATSSSTPAPGAVPPQPPAPATLPAVQPAALPTPAPAAGTPQSPAAGIPAASSSLLTLTTIQKVFAPAPAPINVQTLSQPTSIISLASLPGGATASVQGFSRSATPTPSQPLSVATLAAMPPVGKLLVTVSTANGQNTLAVLGYANAAGTQTGIFSLTMQGSNLILTPLSGSTLSNVRAKKLTGEETAISNAPFNLGNPETGLAQVTFETGTQGSEDHTVWAVNVAPFAYTLVFKLPPAFEEEALVLQQQLSTASGRNAAQLRRQLDAYSNARVNVDCLPVSPSRPFERKLITLSIDTVTDYFSVPQAFPFEVGRCSATLTLDVQGQQMRVLFSRSVAPSQSSQLPDSLTVPTQQSVLFDFTQGPPASAPTAPPATVQPAQPSGSAAPAATGTAAAGAAQQGSTYFFDLDVSDKFQIKAAGFAAASSSSCQQVQLANYVKSFSITCESATGQTQTLETPEHNLIECSASGAVRPSLPLVYSAQVSFIPARCSATVSAPFNAVNADDVFTTQQIAVTSGQGVQQNPIRFNFASVLPAAGAVQPAQPAAAPQPARKLSSYSFRFVVGNKFVGDAFFFISETQPKSPPYTAQKCSDFKTRYYSGKTISVQCTTDSTPISFTTSPVELFACGSTTVQSSPGKSQPFSTPTPVSISSCTATLRAPWEDYLASDTFRVSRSNLAGQSTISFDFTNVQPS